MSQPAAAEAGQAADVSLIARMRSGDARAGEELVRKYLPMVKHIARRYYASFLEFEDLLQEGLIGLLGATREYRPDRFAVKFSSFAYLCILRKIYNVIKQTSGAKHKALNDAVCLFDGARPLLDVLPAAGIDPVEAVEDRLVGERIEAILREHLSALEYTVVCLLRGGYTCREIERTVGVSAKAVDNARTRVKMKLQRLVARYGSLLDPRVPLSARRRPDLCLALPGSRLGT